MRQHVANLVTAFLLGGCSLIYNAGNISPRQIDATPDTQTIDADPSMLSLIDIGPTQIFEGEGDGGSRVAMLVIHGANIVAGAQVTVTGASSVSVDNAQIVIASASDYIAVPLTAHVDPTLMNGTTVGLTVQVTQPLPGGGMAMQTIPGPNLVGLDELTSGLPTLPRYSAVMLATPVVIAAGAAGTSPLVIRAVSSITMGNITARGGGASAGAAGAAGPGACVGAGGTQGATCTGGGKGGATSAILGNGGGGGGAGFATTGTNGVSGGGAGGPGGDMLGDDQIVSFATNQPAGGGGGGGTTLSSAGGGGGGGGGSVEVVAGGNVTVGTIDVTGGNGSNTNGSGGGGGAGGAIIVSSGGAITATALTAAGGAGGSAADNGGGGSVGRTRWDAESGSAPTGSPAAARGPAFAATVPLVLTGAAPTVPVQGAPNKQIDVYTIDRIGAKLQGQPATFDGTGAAMIAPPMQRGYYQVCITIAGGVQGSDEADKCIDVAYLP